jgi:hypothetical protein
MGAARLQPDMDAIRREADGMRLRRFSTAGVPGAMGCDMRNRTRQGTARVSATRKVSAGARNAAVPSPLRPPSVATKIVFDGVPEIRDFPSDERAAAALHRLS